MFNQSIEIKELFKKHILKETPSERYIKKLNDGDEIFKYITKNGFSKISNDKPAEVKRIGIVLPHINVGSGGITSILRIGTFLSKQYKVIYTTYSSVPSKTFENNAAQNLKNFEGEYINWDEFQKQKLDIVIATNWQSVYFTRNLSGYKIYFVQDFEPYFYQRGDLYFLALQTYKMGYHIISLGDWNAKQIQRECNVHQVDFITFPYEPSEYTYKKRDFSSYENKKNFDIAVYLKDNTKRLPLITQSALINIRSLFKERQDIDLKFHIFGYPKSVPLVIGENEGVLGKDRINNLYHRCDFGIVSSVTNVSLVPLEMIATGLPIIEFKYGTYPEFFPADTAILTDFESEDLYSKLNYYLKHPTLISEMTKKALDQIQNRDWKKTGQQFLDIVSKLQN